MSNIPILDLVVGMIFIYFLLSIICSSAVELWFSLMNTRAKLLRKWLLQVFDSPALNPLGNPSGTTLGQSIMDHCMTTSLSKKGKSTSYISAQNFVSVLLDQISIVPPAAGTTPTVQMPPANLAEYITAIQATNVISGELKRTILSFAYQATAAVAAINTVPAAANITNNITAEIKSDIDLFRERLENWYDLNAHTLTSTMKRKKAMPATFIMALVVTVGMNADSIAISKYLYSHPEESKKFADQAISQYQQLKGRVDSIKINADNINKKEKDTVAPVKIQDSISMINSKMAQLGTDVNTLTTSLPPALPIGWQREQCNGIWAAIKLHGFGWLATMLAICLGAPFWFDMLNKIASLRGTGSKPATSNPTTGDNNSNK